MLRSLAQPDDVEECPEKKLQCSVTIAKCRDDIISRYLIQSKARSRPNMPEFQFVDLSVDNTLDQTIRRHQRIALDTEFIREKTFFSRLCLIQVATGDEIFCADPLEIGSADAGLADIIRLPGQNCTKRNPADW